MSFDLKLGAGALAIGSSGAATNNFILRAYPGTGAISPAAGEIGLYRGNDQAESATIFAVSSAGVITVPAQVVAKGTATNDSAAAGYIGEVVESNAAPTVGNSAGNITGIVLTAGDWDISATATVLNGTNTYFQLAISTTNVGMGSTNGKDSVYGAVTAVGCAALNLRVSIAAGATYYLNALTSTGNATIAGYIKARRVR